MINPLFRQTACFLLILIILSFFISCSLQNRNEGYIYYRLDSNPTTLDPARIVDVAGASIAAKLFNGLVRLSENLDIIPDIAERWEIRDEGRTYIFYLKKGVKFINKREVTSYDFKYSFKRILSPELSSPNTWVLEKISGAKEYMNGDADDVSGIETIDQYVLKIKLDRPFSPFLNLLTMTSAYVVPEEEVESRGSDFAAHPVGTGPFVLNEWKHNNQLILIRNEDYFDEQARAEGIVYRIIPEDLTAVTEFELGNLDIITIPAYEYARLRSSPEWKNLISSLRGLNTYYLGFNCARPPFDNRKLRKAVAYSIDRAKIFRTFYEGRGRIASGPVPDLLRRWAQPAGHEYSPDEAEQIIKEEGMKGRTIHFYVTADQEVVDMAEIIQSYIEKTGLQVRIKQLEWSAYKAAINSGEPDIFWLSWWADYADPENFLYPLFHSANHGPSGNRTRYANSEVDRLIEAGQQALDDEEINSSYMLAERIITDELPWVPFWHKTDFIVTQPNIKNFRLYPIYSIDKGIEVSF